MRSNLIDIAIQEYGNQEAISLLIKDNPQLFANDREFDITKSLPDNVFIAVRDEGRNKKVLKELGGKVIVSEE